MMAIRMAKIPINQRCETPVFKPNSIVMVRYCGTIFKDAPANVKMGRKLRCLLRVYKKEQKWRVRPVAAGYGGEELLLR